MAESQKPTLLVSACLLGERCRFDGTDRFSARVAVLGEVFRLIPVCPEVSGGLPTPRPPSERLGDRVVARNDTDFTPAFVRGAEKTLEAARLNQVVGAVLKAKSPSCGVGRIYDGTFRGTLVDGDGVVAEWLRREGIPLWTEDDVIDGEAEIALREIARDFENNDSGGKMTLSDELDALLGGETDPVATLANAAAFLWMRLADLNWAGFYLYHAADDCLMLGPFQGKPACTRIALNRGVCGAAFTRNETLRVADVHAFADHIVCDGASNSELVVPLRNEMGRPFGVLDLDSPTVSRFTEADQAEAEALARIIEKAVRSSFAIARM